MTRRAKICLKRSRKEQQLGDLISQLLADESFYEIIKCRTTSVHKYRIVDAFSRLVPFIVCVILMRLAFPFSQLKTYISLHLPALFFIKDKKHHKQNDWENKSNTHTCTNIVSRILRYTTHNTRSKAST